MKRRFHSGGIWYSPPPSPEQEPDIELASRPDMASRYIPPTIDLDPEESSDPSWMRRLSTPTVTGCMLDRPPVAWPKAPPMPEGWFDLTNWQQLLQSGQRKADWKHATTLIEVGSLAASDNTSSTALNLVSVGTDETNRIGRQITTEGLVCTIEYRHYRVINTDFFPGACVAFLWDENTVGAGAATFSQIFDNVGVASDAFCNYSIKPEHRDRFRLIKFYTIGPSRGADTYRTALGGPDAYMRQFAIYSFAVDLHCKTVFGANNGNYLDFRSGSLLCVMKVEQSVADNDYVINVCSNVFFTDA